MKAVVVNEPGGPEKLLIDEVPEPRPGPGELLVDVTAAGINFIDTYHRSGLYEVDYPMTPGVEGTGVVVDKDDSVPGFRPGDRVAWPLVVGSYAEKHAVPLRWAVPIPDSVSDGVAAALMIQGLTAHYLVMDTFPLRAGQRCLIHAGAGGVGLLVTQIAKMKGAEVITTVGSDEKARLSEQAGADRVVIYTRDDFKAVIEETYGPNSLDVVYDGVGAATFEPGLDLLRPRGTMVTFGNASGPVPPVAPLLLMEKGSLFLTRPTLGNYVETRDELLARSKELFDWAAAGSLEVRIGAELSLEEAADAHRALEDRRTTGKVLLRP